MGKPVAIREEWRKYGDFTDPIRENVNYVVVTGPKSPPVSKLDDLSGKEVYIHKLSAFYPAIEKYPIPVAPRCRRRQCNRHPSEPRRVSPREFRLCLITPLGVITVGVLPGAVVAVIVAIVQLLINASTPHDAVLGRIPGTTDYREAAAGSETETFPGLVIYRFDSGPVFFNGTMPQLDSTGAASLDRLRGDLEDQGIAIAVADAKSPLRSMLQRTGLTDRIGPDRMFPTVDSAVEALFEGHAVSAREKGSTL